LQTFLVRYGAGKGTFTAGADACDDADARDGVEACDWLFDDPGCDAPSSLSTSR
jgi:hypothetical protein